MHKLKPLPVFVVLAWISAWPISTRSRTMPGLLYLEASCNINTHTPIMQGTKIKIKTMESVEENMTTTGTGIYSIVQIYKLS